MLSSCYLMSTLQSCLFWFRFGFVIYCPCVINKVGLKRKKQKPCVSAVRFSPQHSCLFLMTCPSYLFLVRKGDYLDFLNAALVLILFVEEEPVQPDGHTFTSHALIGHTFPMNS